MAPLPLKTRDGSVNLIVEYYQDAFAYLHETLLSSLREATHARPQKVRAEYIQKSFPPETVLDGVAVWLDVRKLLDLLEASMATCLQRHSIFFWMHLYRRIGVMLPSTLESTTDGRTVGLVRTIVELAISKYGKSEQADEFYSSAILNPDLVLGGYMRRGVRAMARSRPSRTYRDFCASLKQSGQWVIRDFSETDFIDLYFVEGLAYQYWRVTALLRTLGKGGKVIFDANGDWKYPDNAEFEWLIRSIDERTASASFDHSLLGVWFEPALGKSEDALVCLFYNENRLPANELLAGFGINIPIPFVSNFLPGLVNIHAYLDAHKIVENAFRFRNGYSLKAFVETLWVLTALALTFSQTENLIDEKLLLRLIQRGYRTLSIEHHEISESVKNLVQYRLDQEIGRDEIEKIIDKLSISNNNQKSISLWSGGPQFAIVPGASRYVAIDLEGVPRILQTLFYRMAHEQSDRGPLFERALKEALRRQGFLVFDGKLRAEDDSEREMDAGVRVGNVLYIFECVSVERPLDYEIGNPKTFAFRRERLEEKIDQALSLRNFIRENDKGRNYDFSWAEKILPFVVSPFEEWVWDRSEKLWENGIPRILSAAEAFRMLRSD